MVPLKLLVGQSYLSESGVIVKIEGTSGKFGSEKYQGSNNRVYNKDGSESRPFNLGQTLRRPTDHLVKEYSGEMEDSKMSNEHHQDSTQPSLHLVLNCTYLAKSGTLVFIESVSENNLVGLVSHRGSNGRTYLSNGQEWRPAGTADASPRDDLVRRHLPVESPIVNRLLSDGGKIKVGKKYHTASGRKIAIQQCHVVSVVDQDHVVLFRGTDLYSTGFYYNEYGDALSGYGHRGSYPADNLVEEITE